mmetsp:Transcript_26661/g.44249  ORF Transcript_26661/g.44249 Transcript_26661/m.44249 type:complete len:90 (-) Transcript_26661:258-527(-)
MACHDYITLSMASLDLESQRRHYKPHRHATPACDTGMTHRHADMTHHFPEYGFTRENALEGSGCTRMHTAQKVSRKTEKAYDAATTRNT